MENNFDVCEMQLLTKLTNLIRSRESFNNSMTNNTINGLKKDLLYFNHDKRVYVLKSLIFSVNCKINNYASYGEIINSLRTIAMDKARKYDSKPDSNLQSNKKNTELIKMAITYIYEQIITEDRDKLLEYEKICNKNIKDSTSKYGIKDATTGILGVLNTGMYEKTKNDFINELKRNYCVDVNKNTRFLEQMSDELLGYRVATLHFVSLVCENRVNEIKNKSKFVRDKNFKSLKRGIFSIGTFAKEEYEDRYGITPRGEIINSFVGEQLTFLGMFPERDKVVRNRNF